MTPNNSASRWYAYNVRLDSRKPETPAVALKSIAVRPWPVPEFIPHKSACNVAHREAHTESFRVGQVRRDLSTITAEMNRLWTPRIYRPTLRDHRT